MVIDTTAEFHAGYIVATLVYLAYAASLWSRARKARAKLAANARPANSSTLPGAR